MLSGALIGALVGLLFAGIGLVVALLARRSYVSRKRPAKLLTLTTDCTPEQVREALLALSHAGRYKLDEDRPEQRLITLSTKPTMFSWGFFLPIYVEPRDGGATEVTIGIESRFFQVGPVVTHHHQQCLSAVKDALAVLKEP